MSSSSTTWQIHGNNFDNFLSQYEISVAGISFTNQPLTIVNATDNFFTFVTADELSAFIVDNRIYDEDEDNSKPPVIFEPYLSSNSTISCDNDCSNQGVCIFPGFCICTDGWSGLICDIPTCQTINFCSGNGNCNAFEECSCGEGWLGASCSVANCTERNNCNGNGFCPIPEVCSCNVGYTGQDCDECDANYRLVDGKCIECPVCENHGTCNSVALCDCIENYVGNTCSFCAEGYFGSVCLPLPFMISTLPTDAPDEGGIQVRISGYNLGTYPDNTTEYRCKFGDVGFVQGHLIGDDEVLCESPVVQVTSSGVRTTELQLYIGNDISFNSLPFAFYGVCPENQCLNGFCSFGRCQCYYGYRGDSCQEALVAPSILPPNSTYDLTEDASFVYQFKLEEGSTPVEWNLLGIPIDGMNIDFVTGLFTWDQPIPNENIQTILVQASNELRSSTVQLHMRVLPSYYVMVTTSTVIETRPSPSVFFDFQTLDTISHQPVGNKLAVLWVNEENNAMTFRRKITIRTGTAGTFRKAYQPYGNDAGTFIYGGEHPSYANLTQLGSFDIMGIDISPQSYYFRGFPNEPQFLDEIFSLSFYGGSFSNITLQFDKVEHVEMQGNLSKNFVNKTDSFIDMTVLAEVSATLRGQIYFTISTNEGLTVSSSFVFVDIRSRIPQIRAVPSSIDAMAIRGGPGRYENVVLENIGSLDSEIIQVVVPEQPILHPVSEFIDGIPVDNTTTVSFQIIAPENLELGSFYSGTIGFISNSSVPVQLSYKVTIVSSVPAILTVITQNEATFLSEEKPNLSDVDIRVRSLSLGTLYTGNSGPNGTIVFDDLVEGFYEIYAQKLQHSSFRQTIFLEPPSTVIEAFLQFEAVSYTFSVIEVPVTDSYEIVVETTFQTREFNCF